MFTYSLDRHLLLRDLLLRYHERLFFFVRGIDIKGEPARYLGEVKRKILKEFLLKKEIKRFTMDDPTDGKIKKIRFGKRF